MVEREVSIYGQSYRVKGEDPERIQRVANYVDGIMTELLGGPAQGISARGAVLAALNVADQWFADKDQAQKLVWDLKQRVDELLALLPE